ncbi:hypothetical protein GIB67_008879 [Kingdonia uniflora]|uniref:RING-type E3 ubiquitin transferase n=1 Tax=Kingdonia uniflora TaxID=39325 RepID=A0A7J7LVB4_9MAGN|nr:hypothetical protein GIB67_008879 [Kingdonia uniflora]
MPLFNDPLTSILSQLTKSTDGALIGIGFAYIAVQSWRNFNSTTSALRQISQTPEIPISDLRSILSDGEKSYEGKMVFVRGIVEAKSTIEASNMMRSDVIIAPNSGELALVLERSTRCLNNRWAEIRLKDLLEWIANSKFISKWAKGCVSTRKTVVGLSTSRAAWDVLQKHYASKSRARIMQVGRELQIMRKGSKPLKDYFLHAKELANSLAAFGHLMSDPDLQQIILSGFDSASDAIVTTLTATMADITMDDFYAHLIAFNMRLEAQTIMLQQHPVANVATQQRNMSLKPGFNQNRNRSYNGNQYRNRGQGLDCPFQVWKELEVISSRKSCTSRLPLEYRGLPRNEEMFSQGTNPNVDKDVSIVEESSDDVVVEMVPFVLLEKDRWPCLDYLIVNIDGSRHPLPLTTVYHQIQPVQVSPSTFLLALTGHPYTIGILDEEKILPPAKEICAIGVCSLKDGELQIESSKRLPYFLEYIVVSSLRSSNMAKDEMVTDLAHKTRVLFWSGIILGSMSLGILGYAISRNWRKLKEWRRQRLIAVAQTRLYQESKEEPEESDEDPGEVLDGQLCVICVRRRKKSVFVPCGHLVCCRQCALIVERDSGPKCPVCRQDITSSVRIYDS